MIAAEQMKVENGVTKAIAALNEAVRLCEEAGFKVSLNDSAGCPFYVTRTGPAHAEAIGGGLLSVPLAVEGGPSDG